MVHGIDGDERSHHLKKVVLCRPTTSPPVQPLRTKTENVKIKNIRSRDKRRVTQHLHHSPGKDETGTVSKFLFSSKVLFDNGWPKYVRKKLLCQRDIGKKGHIHYEEPSKYRKIHWFYDSISICLRI